MSWRPHRCLAPEKIIVGRSAPAWSSVATEVAPHATVVQENQRGTGDAVMAARSLLEGFEGDVLVAYGDTPLVTAKTLGAMVQARGEASDPAVVVLGMRPPCPAPMAG